MDRKIYLSPFHKTSQPEWVCPICNRGILKGKKDSFIRIEHKESAVAHRHPDWEPEWITYSYSCQFVCTNSKCEETVFNVGTGTVEQEIDYSDEQGYYQTYFDLFTPTYFVPHLNLFQISPTTPRNIRDAINKSFELFFANPSAAANQLRIALEHLLDHLKVKTYETSKGKRYLLSLHKRIGLMPKKVSELKDLFLAIKWLGNDASHIEGVNKNDVLDAYEIFEEILEDIFGKKRKEIRKLAKRINKQRG